MSSTTASPAASEMPPRLEIVAVTPLRQNCTILWNPQTHKAVVTDPGGDVDVILARIAALEIEIEAVLLTHGHLDHAGGAQELCEAIAKKASGGHAPMIGPDRRDAFLLDSLVVQASHFGLDGVRNASPDRFVEEGEVLHLAGRSLEVLHVPGHTPGHVVFFDRAARLLLAGDTVFAGSVGRTDFAYGDGPLLIRSIKEKLLKLGDDVIVVPGHGQTTRIAAERSSNPFLR